MGRIELGFYYKLLDFDDENPQQVVNAKLVINEMQDAAARKMREIKRDELSGFRGNTAIAEGQIMSVLKEARAATRVRTAKKVARETMEAVTQANGDITVASSLLGVQRETIRQRLVSYVDRKWAERVGPKEWRILPECMNGEGT